MCTFTFLSSIQSHFGQIGDIFITLLPSHTYSKHWIITYYNILNICAILIRLYKSCVRLHVFITCSRDLYTHVQNMKRHFEKQIYKRKKNQSTTVNTHTHVHPLSLSLSHTHTHPSPHIHSHTHTHTTTTTTHRVSLSLSQPNESFFTLS